MGKRVYIAYVGGTIGMVQSEQGYAPVPGHLEDQVRTVLANSQDQLPVFLFEELQPLIDSSDATPATWHRIARALFERRNEFDGFVVLHGTDTMAYTASALSFLLPDFGKPVVVTGSQVPMGAARSDGRQNVIGALQVAAAGDIAEVGLLFGTRLLRGNRATKVDAWGLEAFDSPNLPALATLGVGIDVNRTVRRPPTDGQAALSPPGVSHVAAVRLFPGIEGTTLDNLCRSPLQGLVIEAYGAGNGPAHDRSFLRAIETATSSGIVVVVVTQCLKGSVSPGAYATGSALLQAGAVPGYDMTTEAALTKLSVLLGRGDTADKVRSLVGRDLAGELTEPEGSS